MIEKFLRVIEIPPCKFLLRGGYDFRERKMNNKEIICVSLTANETSSTFGGGGLKASSTGLH
jgi:hypothetical protein